MKLNLLALIILIMTSANSQSNISKDYVESLRLLSVSKLDSAEKQISKLRQNNLIAFNLLNWQLTYQKYGINDSLSLFNLVSDIKNSNHENKVLFKLNKGDFYLTRYFGLDSVAYRYYKEGLNISISHNDSILICESLRRMLFYTQKFSRDTLELNGHLKNYQLYAKSNTEKVLVYLNDLINKIGLKTKGNKSIILDQDVFDNGIEKSKLINSNILEANFIFLNALNLAVFEGKFEDAISKYEHALSIFSKYSFVSTQNRIFDCYLSLGACNYMLKRYEKSISYLKLGEQIQVTNIKKRDLISLNSWMSKSYEGSNNFKKALDHLKKENVIKDNINQHLQNIAKQDLEKKYETAKKEKENLILQKQKTKNRNIAFGLGGLLFFGGITFLLIQKSTKRKQLLAEQDKELQTQKLATVLKEQELTSIDAMIEGQEKERQRIANDLHDDLGGLMATVKLHFNVLKNKKSPELYDKTNKLLDEAYNKIRTVAHAKNSGVIAKQGLLKAVKEMGRTVSASNKISIDVIDHGLESRLENSLELTLFRIIQELITNVIKHSEATEATIHITNHEDSLNIMVEDNGKGFDPKKITKTSGMGIHSIDKRIENLGGTVTIESEINKGTTVIIDIPS